MPDYGERQDRWVTVPPRADVKRYTEADDTGNAGKDGYTVYSRAPLDNAGTGNWVDPAEADRIDQMDSQMSGMPIRFRWA